MDQANTRSRSCSDLISSLPDHILHQILGLLKTKEAVQTCVLSKRWEHLWTSLPSLDFESSVFPVLKQKTRLVICCFDLSEDEESEDDDDDDNDGESEDYEESEDDELDKQKYGMQKERGWRFVRFVNMFLLRRDPLDLNVFRLSCNGLHSKHARTWIHYAVKHNPRVLCLILCTRLLPSCIYTCTSLEELDLFDCGVFVPATVNLPNLRKLKIRTTCLVKNQLTNLLSGCPLLEFLWLEHCKLDESEIAHEKLQHLTIINSAVLDVHKTVRVTTARYLSPYKATLNLPSLTYACLDFGKYPRIQYWMAMAAFLGGLVNVEILKLRFRWAWLEKGVVLPELPKFQKLQDFSMGVFCMCSGFCLLTWTLESLPNLKKLTLLQEHKCFWCSGKVGAIASDSADASLRVAISQCKSLEFVEVKYWTADRMVRRLVDALVDGTKELKHVKILLSMQ